MVLRKHPLASTSERRAIILVGAVVALLATYAWLAALHSPLNATSFMAESHGTIARHDQLYWEVRELQAVAKRMVRQLRGQIVPRGGPDG